jgi:dihydrolipoamide dehydrogenase
MKYDIIFIGSGPGGYVGAIRAAQLGMKVLVVEKDKLGGVCLNIGCIPTKALLHSSSLYSSFKSAKQFGIQIDGEVNFDFSKVIGRSRKVAAKMSKGIEFLFKKNGVEVVKGFGRIIEPHKVEVDTGEEKKVFEAEHIVIATGARPKQLPGVNIDEERIISYKKALTLDKLPESMVIIGSGAIGTEMAFFYSSFGTKITLVEFLPNVVPLEDEEISKELFNILKRRRIEVLVLSKVVGVDIEGEVCKVKIETPNGLIEKEAELVLSAAGVTANIENIGLDNVGVQVEKGKIKIDEFYRTNVEGIYAIGDVINTPALAHVASAEGIACVEKIAGKSVTPIDYSSIPSCVYSEPEIASVGITEKLARESGFNIKIGKFPFSALGKASASGHLEGFVKLIFEKDTDILVGAHIIGEGATNMISELVLAKKLKARANDIIKSIHPHPTMSEAIMEAAAQAEGEAIHI